MKILPDETAGSLAFRLAQSKQQSVAFYCQEQFDLDLAKARSDLDSRLPSQLSAALARSAKISLTAVQNLHIPNEHLVSVWNKGDLRYSGSIRACPRCLAEHKYGRRFWRTDFAAACPDHGLELLTKCPHCKSDLPYFGDMAGIFNQFWLESWPTCPTCLHLIQYADPAHLALIAISRRWTSALAGRPQRGYSARGFLRLSGTILSRFTTQERYRRLSQLVAPASNWPHHVATALLLRALLSSHTSVNVGYAALGVDFQPDQVAKEIVVCPRTMPPSSFRPV